MLREAAGERSPETLDLITTGPCVFSFPLRCIDGISVAVEEDRGRRTKSAASNHEINFNSLSGGTPNVREA